MYKEVINLLIDHPSYLQSAKNIIRRTIDENDQNENNKILKKLLIKSVQKDKSSVLGRLS